jgi:hypothetical protein
MKIKKNAILFFGLRTLWPIQILLLGMENPKSPKENPKIDSPYCPGLLSLTQPTLSCKHITHCSPHKNIPKGFVFIDDHDSAIFCTWEFWEIYKLCENFFYSA